MTKEEIIENIKTLRKEKNAIVLAHYYQDAEIQGIADFVGDSLALRSGLQNYCRHYSFMWCAFYGRNS